MYALRIGHRWWLYSNHWHLRAYIYQNLYSEGLHLNSLHKEHLKAGRNSKKLLNKVLPGNFTGPLKKMLLMEAPPAGLKITPSRHFFPDFTPSRLKFFVFTITPQILKKLPIHEISTTSSL